MEASKFNDSTVVVDLCLTDTEVLVVLTAVAAAKFNDSTVKGVLDNNSRIEGNKL